MDKDQIRNHLFSNPELIIKLLEEMGCEKVKHVKNRYIISTRPGGKNGSSVNIKLTENLPTSVYSRNDFANKFPGSDIYSLVQYFQGCDFPSSISFVATTCNLQYSSSSIIKEKSESASFLKQFKRKQRTLEAPVEKPLTYSMRDRFIMDYNTLFIDDGVSEEASILFEVGYDLADNRIVFPIKNDEGTMLTVKGRTMQENYKIHGIPKFIYYHLFDARHYLFGFYENYYNILDSDEIFIVESEKGVMQCYSFGVKNVVSTSKKAISDEQVRKLLQLGKKIIICFDKDVPELEIIGECKKFKNLVEVYYMLDTGGLLGAKDSPSDFGVDTWNELYKNRIKYEE